MESDLKYLDRAATVGVRIGAYLIDSFIYSLILLMLLSPVFIMGATGAEGTGIALLVILISIFAFVAFYVLFALRDGRNGQSIGKKMLGLQVLEYSTGLPISWKKSVIRNLWYIFGNGLIYADFAMLFLDKEHRTIADRIASTVVIKK